MTKSKSEIGYQILCYSLVTIFGILCLYPLLYTFSISLVTQAEWAEKNGFILLFPSNPSFGAYTKVWKTGNYLAQSLMISVVRTALSTVGGVILAAILGYVLSRRKLPGKGFLTLVVIFTIFFSGGLIPTYLVVKDLRLTNTIWSLVLPSLLNTWFALIFKQFFANIPEEIEEAAQVDGVSELQLFYKIVLPMSLPVVASISLFTMVNSWNSWFDAMIYIDQAHSKLWPLQYFVSITFNNMAQVDAGAMGDWENIIGTNADVADIATKMALTIISLIPILIIYPFFQKYFTKGVYMGAIK